MELTFLEWLVAWAQEILLTGFIGRTFYFVSAATVVYLCLQGLAYLNKKRFSEVQEKIYETSLGAAVYRVGVVWSLCWLAGAIYS